MDWLKFSPVGELLVLGCIKAMMRGKDPEEVARAIAEKARKYAKIRYNHKVWPNLIKHFIDGNKINVQGRILLEAEDDVYRHVLSFDPDLKPVVDYVRSI